MVAVVVEVFPPVVPLLLADDRDVDSSCDLWLPAAEDGSLSRRDGEDDKDLAAARAARWALRRLRRRRSSSCCFCCCARSCCCSGVGRLALPYCITTPLSAPPPSLHAEFGVLMTRCFCRRGTRCCRGRCCAGCCALSAVTAAHAVFGFRITRAEPLLVPDDRFFSFFEERAPNSTTPTWASPATGRPLTESKPCSRAAALE